MQKTFPKPADDNSLKNKLLSWWSYSQPKQLQNYKLTWYSHGTFSWKAKCLGRDWVTLFKNDFTWGGEGTTTLRSPPSAWRQHPTISGVMSSCPDYRSNLEEMGEKQEWETGLHDIAREDTSLLVPSSFWIMKQNLGPLPPTNKINTFKKKITTPPQFLFQD